MNCPVDSKSLVYGFNLGPGAINIPVVKHLTRVFNMSCNNNPTHE